VGDSVHLPLIHGNTMRGDDIAQELDGGLMELALLQLQVKMMFSQTLKDQLDMMDVF